MSGSKRWIYDDLMARLDPLEDRTWERRFYNSRLFAVIPDDLNAVASTYTDWPDELPPLPFDSCWFESTTAAGLTFPDGICDIQTETIRRPCIGVHLQEYDGQWCAVLGFSDEHYPAEVMPLLVSPGRITTFHGTEKEETDVWRVLIALAELAAAQGVYHEDVRPPRALRRQYERRGSVAPPRTILHIGTPRTGPSVHRCTARDWSCRWWVRGHWRRLNAERQTWVRAYVKGPEGKPWRKPPPRYVIGV